MGVSGQGAPLADVEQLRADVERLRSLQEQLGIPDEDLRAALALQTLVEIRDLDVGGARAPAAVGGRARPDVGTLKGFAFNANAQANQHILSDHIGIDNRVAVLRTTVALDSGAAASVFSAHLHDGSNNSLVDFNNGDALTPGALYAFDLPVSEALEINYQINNTDTVAVIVAQEIDTAGP